MNIQFIKPRVVPYGIAPAGENDTLRMIELCGRTAYKSEDRISDASARKFVLMLRDHRHLSVLEHSNIVFRIGCVAGGSQGAAAPGCATLEDLLLRFLKDRSSYHRLVRMTDERGGRLWVAGNVRAWLETLERFERLHVDLFRLFAHHLALHFPQLFPADLAAPASLPFQVALVEPTEQLEMLRSDPSSDLPVFIFKCICDRGITHEIVRHRVLSFTQESTRYVNYRNKGMTLMLPEELDPFFDAGTETVSGDDPRVRTWLDRAAALAAWYDDDVKRGLKPEIARDILPNLLKSEIFVSGRWSGWRHFVELRDSPQAHPRVRFIARQVRDSFASLGLFIP